MSTDDGECFTELDSYFGWGAEHEISDVSFDDIFFRAGDDDGSGSV